MTDQFEPIPPRRHYAWLILVIATLVVFGVLGLARFGYTMLLPSMQETLGLDNTRAGDLAMFNMVGYLVLAIVGGALAARFGPRAVIVAGMAVVAAGMLLTGMSHRFAAAALWRGVTGIGTGAANVAVMGLLVAWFAPHRRGTATGIAVTGSSFAIILLGPTVPRLLAARPDDGWRICWGIFAVAAAAIVLLCAIALRDRPADKGLLPLGAAPDDPPPTSKAAPLEWGRVYRSPVVWLVGAIYTAFGFSYIIYITFFTKFLVAEVDFTPQAAGRLFMAIGWTSLVCGVLWGWVSDKIGRRGALVIVYLIHATAFGLFGWRPMPGCLTISAVLYGLTAWSIPAIMAALCGDLLGPRLAPAGLGFLTLFFGIGQAAGPHVAGRLADAAGSLAPGYMLASGVALLGAFASLFLPHRSMGKKAAAP